MNCEIYDTPCKFTALFTSVMTNNNRNKKLSKTTIGTETKTTTRSEKMNAHSITGESRTGAAQTKSPEEAPNNNDDNNNGDEDYDSNQSQMLVTGTLGHYFYSMRQADQYKT
jgi:hypothetical protein